MIDPTFAAHRARLAANSQHWFREHEVYRADRAEGIVNYIGSTQYATSLLDKTQVDEKNKQRMIGNLIQMAGQARMIQLAFNSPRYTCVPNIPAGDLISLRGEEYLNRYSLLIGVGDVARSIALDSFFGFGIVEVDEGILPYGVQRMTGQQIGPMCRRISQDHFLFDGSASNWDHVGYVARMFCVPLDEAQQFEPFLAYNPDAARALREFNMNGDQTDSRVHRDSGNMFRSPQGMTRLIKYYFPGSGVQAIWPCNDSNFAAVSGEPLFVAPWRGHHTGPIAVLSDLDIPDNLIPVPQMESTKRLHYLFNELAHITSEQALEARYNPTFEMGSQRDIDRWLGAKDREPIPVADNKALGSLEIPGPTQSQTSAMLGALQMFKEFNGNMDDTLGLGTTAATAGQSKLIRSATTARGAEMRNRMDRVMELVGRKLLHLAMGSTTLSFPMQRTIPGTKLTEDVSWLPPHVMPRVGTVDDYTITVIPGSMRFRSPEERLAQLGQAIARIMQVAQMAMQGIPVELSKYVEIEAKYNDLPELRDMFPSLLPDFQNAKAQVAVGMSNPNKPNGEYTRANVSERSDQGALVQALTQFGGSGATGEAA